MVQALRSGASRTHTAGGFVMVPVQLLLDKRVSGDEVRLWAVLDDLQRDEPYVDATTHQLAEVLDCSHDTVQRRVDKLAAARWLSATRNRGLQRANRYIVHGSPRRSPASAGLRNGARNDAYAMAHANLREPSPVPRSEKEVLFCSNKECTDGWVNIQTEGRFGVYDTVARCPQCTPAPF